MIAGGGTAGHVNPAIALANALSGDDVSFVGTATGAEADLVPAAGFALHRIEVEGFDRARPLALPAVGYRAARAVAAARRHLREVEADVVVGMGGYVSLPVCIAASTARIPVVIHEQNIVFGLANRVAKRFARRVAVSFRESLPAAGRHGVFVGNPVRDEIVQMDRERERAAGIEELGLDPARRTVLVFGGSQGARSINQAAVGLRDLWSDRTDRQIVHITGRGFEPPHAETSSLIYRSPSFMDRMIRAYAVADVAVCRGGATTLAELTVVGLPALVVPYPYHRDRQQERQARVLEAGGACRVVLDGELTPGQLGNDLDRILGDDDTLDSMGAAALALGRPTAAADLADVVRGVA
ncbi:MAG TPA: undecaprenyldiphospho-muramoylpentapeptide beta-N-acetylglucosaminyltransferase [Actinomycetota bacterium]|nr:undecaprenyldiphospho-muramoylpentapeptide beta-N-acetylglucosaminyltransferase [Actinomycetota bacterium]